MSNFELDHDLAHVAILSTLLIQTVEKNSFQNLPLVLHHGSYKLFAGFPIQRQDLVHDERLEGGEGHESDQLLRAELRQEVTDLRLAVTFEEVAIHLSHPMQELRSMTAPTVGQIAAADFLELKCKKVAVTV